MVRVTLENAGVAERARHTMQDKRIINFAEKNLVLIIRLLILLNG